jgi:glycogen(starch) synthase
LNQRLKHFNSPITVVAFIIMPAPHHSFTVESLKGQAVMKQLRETVQDIQEKIGSRIFDQCSQ